MVGTPGVCRYIAVVISPAAEIHPVDGFMNTSQIWPARLAGSVPTPWSLNHGVICALSAGSPLSSGIVTMALYRGMALPAESSRVGDGSRPPYARARPGSRARGRPGRLGGAERPVRLSGLQGYLGLGSGSRRPLEGDCVAPRFPV